ncbi:MAG TPA: PAS domain S-box protein [Rubrobacteraceae bacterium]|nr:PAS domain S-box protein [Rubrobacteraceae bacterium]
MDDAPEDMEAPLKEADRRGEPYEIVISDYYMPRFKGPDALDLLKTLGYDLPFIVVSGKVGEELAVEMMQAGAQDYITKENMVRLNAAVKRELREARVRRERERAEEAFRRSENRFRRLVEQAADAMFVHDREGRFLEVNRRACESLGYTREELLGMSVPDVEMDYRPGALEKLWSEVASGKQRTLEGLHRRKDGTTFPVEVRLGMFESEGTPQMLATARDVTERKKAEGELRESEERFRLMVEEVRDYAIFMLDPEGCVATWNTGAERIEGYAADEIIGKHFSCFYLEEEIRSDKPGLVLSIVASEGRYEEEGLRVREDGSRFWAHVLITALRDEHGTLRGFSKVVRDITERKRQEEALQEVREAERNRIARDLHDDSLQNLVYALQEIQILQVLSGDGRAPELQEIYDALRRSVEGLRGAIFELQLETLHQSFITSLRSLVDLNRRMSRERYKLELSVEAGFPQEIPEAGGRDLLRIIQEALNNARRHSDASHVRVSLGVDGDLLRAEVADGRGFDPRTSTGGVGQHSMRQWTRNLGGELRVESEPGAGTTVCFQIPYSQ